MGIRTGFNAPLGMPRFSVLYDDDQGIPAGTIINGYDDTNDRNNEYIWLPGAANIAVGDDVTYDQDTYAITEIAAGTGQADALVDMTAITQYAWFELKTRRAAA